MVKYKKLGETISISLKDGYGVYCLAYWNKDEKHYCLNNYLYDERLDIYVKLTDKADIPIYAKKNTLYSEISKYIETLIEDRYFDYHIKEYELLRESLDVGFDICVNSFK